MNETPSELAAGRLRRLAPVTAPGHRLSFP
jgi:hypothetical protein